MKPGLHLDATLRSTLQATHARWVSDWRDLDMLSAQRLSPDEREALEQTKPLLEQAITALKKTLDVNEGKRNVDWT